MTKRILYAIGTLAILVFSVPGLGQTVSKQSTRSADGWIYRYAVTNNPTNSTQSVKRFCVDFVGGVESICRIESPIGWVPSIVPPAGGNPGKICWTTAGNGIPHGPWPFGGFEVEQKSSARFLEGDQRWHLDGRLAPTSNWFPIGAGSGFTQELVQAGYIHGQQTLPAHYERVRGPGSGLPGSLLGSQDFTAQFVFDAAGFDADAPLEIEDLSFRAAQAFLPLTPTADWSITITMATWTQSTPYGAQPNFASNLQSDAMVVFSGLLAVPSLQPGERVVVPLAQPFAFDPSAGAPLVVEMRACVTPTSIPLVLDVARSVGDLGGNQYVQLGSCTAASWSTAGDGQGAAEVPILGLTYRYIRDYQINRPELVLILNDAVGFGDGPAQWVTGVQAPLTFGLDTLLPGAPFDLGLIPALPVPGLPAAGGQWINIDLLDPAFTLLHGGLFQNALLPFEIPLPPAPTPVLLSTQAVILDPASPGGYILSAAANLDVRAHQPQTVPLTFSDEGVLRFSVDAFGCAPVTVFEHPFTDFYVSANGRILFGGADDRAPTLPDFIGGFPSVGLGLDLDPSLGGQVVVQSPAPNLIEVIWNQVPVAGQPQVPVTFGIGMDLGLGEFALFGLDTLGVNPSLPGFFGISPGGLLMGVDPGPLPLPPLGGVVPSPGPLSALHIPLAIPGLDLVTQALVLTPDGAAGYTVNR